MEENKSPIMDRIAEANKAATTGIDAKDIENWITIYIMGKAYTVPADLTILTAMEYAGYKFVRGVGCRQGFCGACATVFRKKGDYKLQTGMACQTRAEDGMYLVQIPFTPAEKAEYDITKEPYEASVFIKYYPEVTRCVSCNTCTKSCPQDIKVMMYIQNSLRGNIMKAAELSFDCIQCGMCAMRCPADIKHYHVGQLARRLRGKYLDPESKDLTARLEELKSGKFDSEMEELVNMNEDAIIDLYKQHRLRFIVE